MHAAPIIKLTGCRAAISEGRAEMTIPVARKLMHGAGAVHGSILFLALDNAAFFAANSLIEKVMVLTASFTIYFFKPVTEGRIRAIGQVVSRGRSQLVAEAVAHDDVGRQVARGSGIFVPSRIPLASIPGYDNDGTFPAIV